MKIFPVAAFALVALPLLAQAQEFEPGGYVSGFVGQSRYDWRREGFDEATQAVLEDAGFTPSSLSSAVDRSDAAFGASLGYRFSPFAAIEAGYLTLGEATYRSTSTVTAVGLPGSATAALDADLRVRGATAGLAAFVPIGSRFDLHARGGVFFAQSKLTTRVALDGDSGSDSGTGHSRDGWYGYGVGYRVWNRVHATIDYTHFRNVGDRSETIERTISLLHGGLLYRF